MKTEIIVENSDLSFNIDISFWKKISKKIFLETINLVNFKEKFSKYANCNFSFDILFVSNEEIKNINAEYRKKDVSTDVITFALFFDSEDKTIIENTVELGEIIISLEKAKEQAIENGIPFEVEITTLIIHGILHLLGFDHMTENDYDYVVNIQNRVLEILNKENLL